jgi:hypothetical protein
MKKTLALLLLPAALVAAFAVAEDRVDRLYETSTTLQSVQTLVVDGGCIFSSSGYALQDGGMGPRLVFGSSPSFFVASGNATCSALLTGGLKCLKYGLGLDGGGCP